MKRISATLLLSVVGMAASLSAAHAQTSNRFPFFSSGSKTATSAPVTTQRLVPVAGQVTYDPSVELAALEARTITIPAGTAGSGPGGPSVQCVNCRSLVIDFEVKAMGTSGVGSVELWYTRNGQTWTKYGGAPQTQSPFAVDVTDDGLYGFTVVATNGMGIGKTPPQPGDAPQMWVDVDTTRPDVHLLSTQAGGDDNGRTLTLRWTATDRNLVARPITLAYAEQAQGPWIPFATNLDNCGQHTWRMSPGLPSQVLVRVTATDRVGNIGEDQSTMPAPVDLTRPAVSIRNVSRNGTLLPTSGH